MSALTQPLFSLSIETLCPYLISSINIPRRTLPGSNFCPCDASAFHVLDTGVHLSLKRLLRVVAFDHLALAVFSKFCSFYLQQLVVFYCTVLLLSCLNSLCRGTYSICLVPDVKMDESEAKGLCVTFLLSFPANVDFSGAAECRQWTPAVFFSGVHSAPWKGLPRCSEAVDLSQRGELFCPFCIVSIHSIVRRS